MATAEPPWNYLYSIWFPSPLPALHIFLLKDLVLLEPNSKLSATYENGKKTPVSCKLSAASRLNSLFCLCLIPKLSKTMAQLDCCCRLTQAEINGIVSSGCVWRPPRLHEIIFILYDVHLHFLLFTCFFWKICSRSYSSKHAASQCETCIIRIANKQWSASYARCSKEKGATETS